MSSMQKVPVVAKPPFRVGVAIGWPGIVMLPAARLVIE